MDQRTSMALNGQYQKENESIHGPPGCTEEALAATLHSHHRNVQLHPSANPVGIPMPNIYVPMFGLNGLETWAKCPANKTRYVFERVYQVCKCTWQDFSACTHTYIHIYVLYYILNSAWPCSAEQAAQSNVHSPTGRLCGQA